MLHYLSGNPISFKLQEIFQLFWQKGNLTLLYTSKHIRPLPGHTEKYPLSMAIFLYLFFHPGYMGGNFKLGKFEARPLAFDERGKSAKTQAQSAERRKVTVLSCSIGF